MKKMIFLLIFLIGTLILWSQNHSYISIDYQRYFNNYENFQRKNGVSLGYKFEHQLNDYLFLTAGINHSLIQDEFHQ